MTQRPDNVSLEHDGCNVRRAASRRTGGPLKSGASSLRGFAVLYQSHIQSCGPP
ncbi:UNVERIFIED_ORG: hypothetical protein GGE64_005083 [Rhizobium etli]